MVSIADTRVKPLAQIRAATVRERTARSLTVAALTIFPAGGILREDIRRAGVEIREGVRDPDMGHPAGWAYQYTWFRRPTNERGA